MIDSTYRIEGETLVFGLKGRLDDETASEAEQRIDELLQRDESRWVVDLGEIEQISGRGLRVLVTLGRKLATRKGRLVLCAPRPRVAEALAVSMFNRHFKIVTSVDDALAGKASLPSFISGSYSLGGIPIAAAAVADLLHTSETEVSQLPMKNIDRIADAILCLLESGPKTIA